MRKIESIKSIFLYKGHRTDLCIVQFSCVLSADRIWKDQEMSDRPTRLSEIKGLCLVKCSRESLQFFSYLWNENTLYFVFILCYFIFPLILSNCPGLC